MKRSYELVVVLKPTLQQDKRKKLLDTIKTWLKDLSIVKEAEWGQKVLAYPIKKELSGYFAVYTLETEQSLPSDFEKRLISNEDILRHLVVRRK